MQTTPPSDRSTAQLEMDNARLRRELVNALVELDIAKKAAAYYAGELR